MKCPTCGHDIKRKDEYSLIHDYGPSTATAYIESFSHIVDVLGEPLGKVTKEELINMKVGWFNDDRSKEDLENEVKYSKSWVKLVQ